MQQLSIDDTPRFVGLGPGPVCAASSTVLAVAEGDARVPVLPPFTYVLQYRLIKQLNAINTHGIRAERARRTAREGGELQKPITLTR